MRRRTLAEQIESYDEWMAVHHFSADTRKVRKPILCSLITWLDERGITDPSVVTRSVLERYQRWLYRYRKADGAPLSPCSQHARLVLVRSFFRWMTRQGIIGANPAADLELPRYGRRLPQVLTIDEIARVLQEPAIDTPTGLRDRAILETFYSTGMRRMEVVNLKRHDIDQSHGTVLIRQGKGRKDRMAPIGSRAVQWIDRYVEEARPHLVIEPDGHWLFISEQGGPFSRNHLTDIVRGYIRSSGIDKKGSCHLFRHTMATQMLEAGADVRFIQELLGHSSLNTTTLYTQVSIRQLKTIHSAFHPANQGAASSDAASLLLAADVAEDDDDADV